MYLEMFLGLGIPFFGTMLGAAVVFFLKKGVPPLVEKFMLGFAAGVMIAASVFSLLLPAMEEVERLHQSSWLVTSVGFLLGIFFLLVLDEVIPHIHVDSDQEEGIHTSWKKTTKLFFAMTLHNIPEGMSLGIVFAGLYSANTALTIEGALALSMGIAIQNFPEGAVISLPLHSQGMSRMKSFLLGTASGIVEPIGAFLTILFSAVLQPVLPWLLAFAAGAMVYVCVEELIPQSQHGQHSNIATIAFAIGFACMMILDTALG